MARAPVRAAQPIENDEDEMDTPAFVSIMDRKSSDFKPPKLIPGGTWKVRHLTTTSKQRSDNEGEYEIVSLIHEPYEATDSVDPEEVNEVDPTTGASVYEGRRIETAFFIRNSSDVLKMLRVIAKHGVDVDDREMVDILADLKGSFAYGFVGSKAATTTREAENKISLWTSEEKYLEKLNQD